MAISYDSLPTLDVASQSEPSLILHFLFTQVHKTFTFYIRPSIFFTQEGIKKSNCSITGILHMQTLQMCV